MVQQSRRYGDPSLGAGIGLRRQHFREIIDRRPAIRWFEIIPENFIGRGGFCTDALRQISEHYALIVHGVSLSIGSTDELDRDHLRRLKSFCDEVNSPWFSDHLCFTMVDHVNLNDLIPLPFTRETVRHVAERARIVQDIIERPFLLENVTYYMAPSRSEMTEAQFITDILEQADCGLLLDVSNVLLNSKNQKYDADAFLDAIPMSRVGQLHLGGFEEDGDILLDTHAKPVADDTWALYRRVIERTGPMPTLIEWDSQIPSLDRLLQEATMAQQRMDEVASARTTVA